MICSVSNNRSKQSLRDSEMLAALNVAGAPPLPRLVSSQALCPEPATRCFRPVNPSCVD